AYLYSLWWGKDKASAWLVGALLVGAGAYVLAFVWPLDYPYGWFKALAFVAFAFVGAAVGGFWALLGPEGEPRPAGNKRVMRLGALAGGMALAALAVVTTLLTVGRYWGQPVRYDRAMVEAGAVRDVIGSPPPRDASVYISNSPNMQPLGRLFN